MLPSEEENTRCWDYVMKFSLDEIQSKGDSELNQLCSSYINSKKTFMRYVEDKRRLIIKDIREKQESRESREIVENGTHSEAKQSSTATVQPVLGRNSIYYPPKEKK
jgi:hypothetical protein